MVILTLYTIKLMAHIFEYLKQQVHKSRAEKEIRDRESGSDY
jgi:hypothetical protein